MATKKVEALEEKLKSEIGAVKTAVESEISTAKIAVESEIGTVKTAVEERFNRFQEQFSNLETMISRLMEEKARPRPESQTDAVLMTAGSPGDATIGDGEGGLAVMYAQRSGVSRIRIEGWKERRLRESMGRHG